MSQASYRTISDYLPQNRSLALRLIGGGKLHCVANCSALTNIADCIKIYGLLRILQSRYQQSQYLAKAVLCFQNATLLLWHHMMGGARAHLRYSEPCVTPRPVEQLMNCAQSPGHVVIYHIHTSRCSQEPLVIPDQGSSQQPVRGDSSPGVCHAAARACAP